MAEYVWTREGVTIPIDCCEEAEVEGAVKVEKDVTAGDFASAGKQQITFDGRSAIWIRSGLAR